jgi:predicted nucleic acid-binding protein
LIAVVDASAAVRVSMKAGGPDSPETLLDRAELVLAPELIIAEVVNAFWKYLRAGVLSRALSERGVRTALDLVDEFAPMEPLSVEALHLAALHERAAYDMFYLVLARRNGAVLITADEALRRSARNLGIRTSESE